MVRTWCFHCCKPQVQAMVRKLRSCKLCSTAKKKELLFHLTLNIFSSERPPVEKTFSLLICISTFNPTFNHFVFCWGHLFIDSVSLGNFPICQTEDHIVRKRFLKNKNSLPSQSLQVDRKILHYCTNWF